MSIHLEGLVAAVQENPYNLELRNVCADALEEEADPDFDMLLFLRSGVVIKERQQQLHAALESIFGISIACVLACPDSLSPSIRKLFEMIRKRESTVGEYYGAMNRVTEAIAKLPSEEERNRWKKEVQEIFIEARRVIAERSVLDVRMLLDTNAARTAVGVAYWSARNRIDDLPDNEVKARIGTELELLELPQDLRNAQPRSKYANR